MYPTTASHRPQHVLRGGHPGDGVCSGFRLHTHRKAAIVCVRCCQQLQDRYCCAGGLLYCGKNPRNPDREVRLACRNDFRQSHLLDKIIPTIEEVLAEGEMERPKAHGEEVEIAIPHMEGLGDVGHHG